MVVASDCGCSCCINGECAEDEECEQVAIVAGIVVGAIVVAIGCTVAMYFLYRRRMRRTTTFSADEMSSL